METKNKYLNYLRNFLGLNRSHRKSLEDVVSETICYKKDGASIIILGGSKREFRKVYNKIMEEDSSSYVIREKRGYQRKEKDYIINLDIMKIDYGKKN